MTTTAPRGRTITLGLLCIRAIVLNGRSWTLRCARIITQPPLTKCIPLHVGAFWLGNLNTMGKLSLSPASLGRLGYLGTDGFTSRLGNRPTSDSHKLRIHSHRERLIAPSLSGTAEARWRSIFTPSPLCYHITMYIPGHSGPFII